MAPECRPAFKKKTQQGIRSHHVHIYNAGADHIERHLAFRDFLLAHPAAAAEYSALKQQAPASRPLTRQAYQDRKEPLIASPSKPR
ncbi:GrpB family protein [Hymenobacter sp. NST-14]|uniref:GrpB family protein n=1 Tax=Hymenobacter piscis TaxID=2839984 RepID=UPI001C010626|nr:GrpB family protein [Hymenobacter piscis]